MNEEPVSMTLGSRLERDVAVLAADGDGQALALPVSGGAAAPPGTKGSRTTTWRAAFTISSVMTMPVYVCRRAWV
jgi:hypothetical protein